MPPKSSLDSPSRSRAEGPAAEASLFDRIKEAGLHTLVYGIGSVVQSLVAFLLTPIITRYLSPSEYGIFALATLCGSLAGAIGSLGIASALARSYYDHEALAARRQVVTTSWYLSLAGAGILLAAGIAFQHPLSALIFHDRRLGSYLCLAIASAAVTSLNNLLLVILRFERRSTAVVVTTSVGAMVSAVLIITGLAIFHLGIFAPVLGILMAQVATGAILLALARKNLGRVWSFDEAVLQLRFGLPVILVTINYYILDTVDRFFIKSYGTMADVGVYSLGYRVGMLVQVIFVLPFSQIWGPMRMQYGASPQRDELFRTVLTYYAMIGLMVVTIGALFAPELIHLLARRPEYAGASRVVPLVLLGQLLYGTINILDFGIVQQRKVMYHVYVFFLGILVNSGLNLLFIPKYGYIAAAYATLISYAVVAITIAAVSHRCVPIAVEYGRLMRIILSSGLVWALSTILPRAHPVLAIALDVAVLLTLLGYWWRSVLESRERRRFIDLWTMLVPQVLKRFASWGRIRA